MEYEKRNKERAKLGAYLNVIKFQLVKAFESNRIDDELIEIVKSWENHNSSEIIDKLMRYNESN